MEDVLGGRKWTTRRQGLLSLPDLHEALTTGVDAEGGDFGWKDGRHSVLDETAMEFPLQAGLERELLSVEEAAEHLGGEAGAVEVFDAVEHDVSGFFVVAD